MQKGNKKLIHAKQKSRKKTTSFEEHLTKRYGKIGTIKRTDFEIKAKAFAIGEIIKEERRLSKMTQEELAQKTIINIVSFTRNRIRENSITHYFLTCLLSEL